MKDMAHLSTEWLTLHQNIEQYERLALVIKIVAFIFTVFAVVFTFPWLLATALLAVLWLQEGIIKTFQKRLNEYILTLELSIQNQSNVEEITAPFQLYSQWEQHKPNTIGLINQYISNSLKPTVMYPYLVLIVMLMIS